MKKFLIIFIGAIIGFLTFVSVPIYIKNDCGILPWPVVTKWGLPWKKMPCKYVGVMWGKSLLEYGNDFKCVVDKQGFCFLYGSCKPNECNPKIEYKTNDSKIEQLINNGCISYFDGCNTCSVDASNSRICTLMWCETMQTPKCLQYK
jgi:hypothetical protein